MNWEQASKYHLTCGPWTISKCFVRGKPVYQLWRQGQFVATGRLDELKNTASSGSKVAKAQNMV